MVCKFTMNSIESFDLYSEKTALIEMIVFE